MWEPRGFPQFWAEAAWGGFQVHWPSLMGGSEGSAPWCIGLSIPLHLLCSYGMFPQLWAPAEEGRVCQLWEVEFGRIQMEGLRDLGGISLGEPACGYWNKELQQLLNRRAGPRRTCAQVL